MIHGPSVPGRDAPECEPSAPDEERVRHQISAAEELRYLGHAEPALVAAGAALAGLLRLRGGFLAGYSASCAALLEALLATGQVSTSEHDVLYRLLQVHELLTRGYAPGSSVVLGPEETESAVATMVSVLERPQFATLGRG